MSIRYTTYQDSLEIAVAVLKDNEVTLRFTAPGFSMAPFILDGDVLEVRPCILEQLRPMDVLLYTCEGKRLFAHRLLKVRVGPQGVTLFLRGDSRTGVPEQVKPEWILGKVVAVKRNEQWLRLDNSVIYCLAHLWVITPDVLRRVLWWVGGGWFRLWLESYVSCGSNRQDV